MKDSNSMIRVRPWVLSDCSSSLVGIGTISSSASSSSSSCTSIGGEMEAYDGTCYCQPMVATSISRNVTDKAFSCFECGGIRLDKVVADITTTKDHVCMRYGDDQSEESTTVASDFDICDKQSHNTTSGTTSLSFRHSLRPRQYRAKSLARQVGTKVLAGHTHPMYVQPARDWYKPWSHVLEHDPDTILGEIQICGSPPIQKKSNANSTP